MDSYDSGTPLQTAVQELVSSLIRLEQIDLELEAQLERMRTAYAVLAVALVVLGLAVVALAVVTMS